MKTFKEKYTDIMSRIGDFFKRYIISPDTKMWKWIKPKWLHVLLKTIGVLTWAVFPFCCFIAIEYINFLDPAFDPATGSDLVQLTKMFTSRQAVVIFDLIILYGIAVLLVMLFKRLWASCAVLGGLSFALALTSFLKYQARNEYFYPWDIQQAGNVGTLTEYINTTIPVEIVQIALILFTMTAVVFFTKANLPIRWYIRIPPALLTVLILFNTYSVPSNAAQLVQKYDMSFFDAALQESNYSANGFIGAFAINILSSSVSEPENYSKDTVDSILGEYEYKDAGEDFKSPNVILVLQESFWDITKLPNCTFSTDPLANFKEISGRDNVYTGSYSSPTLGGGTVNPEFETLTGLVTTVLPSGAIPYQYVYDNIDGYPSLFKSIGYKTMAVHPYYSTFYLRDAKYSYLSFDETWFYENLSTDLADIPIRWRGKNVSDETFFTYIEHFIEETDDPLFMFGISMESHQPYPNKFTAEQLEITVECDLFDPSLLNTVNQYTQCIYDADRAIGAFVEYLDNCEEDTILVLYGDHAPSLGTDLAAYRKSGLVAQTGMVPANQREHIYTTPFMIYANFDLGESTMLSEDPSQNKVAPYHLMNTALEMIDAPQTPLMQYLRDYYEILPNYEPPLLLSLDDKMNKFISDHKLLSYDRISGKKYSVAK